MSIKITPDWWKTLFDELYLITDARSVCNEALTAREVDMISRLIPMRPGQKILDLCGGHGRHALELCRRGFVNCTVFDFSRALLRAGAHQASLFNLAVEFVQGDARDVQLPSGAYHHVLILGNSLGYAGESGADLEILREAHRLLTTEGWILIDVADGRAVQEHFSPNAWHEIGDDVVVCRQREMRDGVVYARELILNKDSGLLRDQNYCMRLYTAEELIHLVATAGFGNIQLCNDFSPYQGEGDLGFMNHRMVVAAQKL